MDRQNKKLGIFSWCLYDWGNSSFATVITTFIFATYFTKSVAANPIVGTHQWGNAVALASIFIALFSPIFGAVADNLGKRKPWLGFFTVVTVIATALLWYVKPEVSSVGFALICFVIATITMEIGTVFYNAMLRDIAPAGYLGRISGWGWGIGYLGGLTCLIIALIVFVQGDTAWLGLDTAQLEQIRICSPLVAVWFLIFSLPLFLFTPDRPATGASFFVAVRQGLLSLKQTFLQLKQHRRIIHFIIAQMIYIDGLNTVFAFGGIYAAGTFNLSFAEIIQFGIAMNITAGIGAVSFAWLDDGIGSKRTILTCLICMILLTTALLFVQDVKWFWILALTLGLFVGPTQAASRTLMSHIAPPEMITEMFGFYALSGRITAFLGPFLFGLLTAFFHSQRAGMSIVVVFWVIGGLILAFLPYRKS